MALTPTEQIYLSAIQDRQSKLEAAVRFLVDQNTFTENRDGISRLVSALEPDLEDLGFRCSALIDGRRGPTLVARRLGDPDSHRLLLLGHLDTVHPPDGPFQQYQAIPGADDRATGPGCADMKGGVIVILEALRALHLAGRLKGRHITLVLNSDEETGSVSSADLIRAEAMESHLALCFEAGRPHPEGGSTFVTERRGFGRMTLRARGRAAHAGVDPSAGASAVLELAHKAIALSELTERFPGCSVTVGVLSGGTAANVVPEEAHLELDYRFGDQASKEHLEEEIFREAARNVVKDQEGRPAVATTMHDQVGRPAMVRSEAMGRMAARIVAWGQDLGLILKEEARGGSSDAALAADSGCPAVCGLGAVGGAFHTKDEWIVRTSLVERAQLAALTIDRFFGL
jgi:glutamate carboxypeptidase